MAYLSAINGFHNQNENVINNNGWNREDVKGKTFNIYMPAK